MLRIRGLKKKFKNFQALDGLSMEIGEGALYGFVGPNGAGKTTAIRIITGLLEPDAGSVEIAGIDALRHREQVKEHFGYVPDEFGMYDNLKVREYMEFFASCCGLAGLVARKRCMELLEQMKLADRTDVFVDHLSRGQKQRLCLARAMIHDPELLVLDEPTSGMDPRTRMEFKEMLKELCAEGKTILISSHILPELAQMCTDVGIIDAGRIVLAGSMQEIRKKMNDSNPLRIRLCGERERAAALLRADSRVDTIAIGEDELSVGFRGDREAEAELLARLTGAGIRVNGFFREQGDLEHIFMQITDHEKGRVVMRSADESGLPA